MAKERRIVKFSGDVQGVGFRYMAARAAVDYDITGYVKNMPDSSVEIVAEGEPTEIDAFLKEVTRQMAGYIRDVKTQTAPPLENMQDFGIRH